VPAHRLSDVLRSRVDARLPVALVTVIDGPGVGNKLLIHPDDAQPLGSLGDEELDRVVGRDALGELASATSDVRHYGPHGETGESTVTVFIESFAPPPRLLIFGAVDFTAALARVGKVLGCHVTVCDAREVFATRARFPFADDVVVDWPHRLLERIDPPLGPTDAICVLTHDHKFDIPAIRLAVQSQVGYLGAMGSRRTHDERVERLRAEGLTDEQLARLHAPIGLDLGARTPEETAISIVAEIIAARTGRQGASLAVTDGPIH
jgi:xanthine dehydrogenase accessory factor